MVQTDRRAKPRRPDQSAGRRPRGRRGMKFIGALIATIAFSCLPAWAAVAEPQPDACDVPASFIESEIDLSHATDEMKEKHRLDITVLGRGSSALAVRARQRFGCPGR